MTRALSAAAAAERARGAPLKFAGASTTIALEELRGTGGSSMLAFLRGRLDDTRLASLHQTVIHRLCTVDASRNG